MKPLTSVLIAALALIISGSVAILCFQQNRFLEYQHTVLQKQIQELRQQIKPSVEPEHSVSQLDQFMIRNQLVTILYDEKEVENSLLGSLFDQSTQSKKKRAPAANERLRRDAALQFVKLEYEAGKRWREIDLSNAFLSGVEFRQHELRKLNMIDALERSDFSDADLQKSNFHNTNLFDSNFMGADLQRAFLFGADLEGAAFSGANMNKANLGTVNAEGASFIETQLEGVNFYAANLKGAYFWESHLEGASFWKAHLEETAMSGAFLQRASFRAAHMKGTELSGANLEGASFVGAHMEKANLRGADLAGANFGGATLEGVTVDSPDWINQLRQLEPPVENFHFDDWSIVESEDEYGEKVFVLTGPLVAPKPESI